MVADCETRDMLVDRLQGCQACHDRTINRPFLVRVPCQGPQTAKPCCPRVPLQGTFCRRRTPCRWWIRESSRYSPRGRHGDCFSAAAAGSHASGGVCLDRRSALAAQADTSAKRGNDLIPQWIWSPDHAPQDVPQVSCYFRKTIHLPGPHRGTIRIAADDVYRVYVNGTLIGEGASSRQLTSHDLTAELRDGKNVIAVKVDNRNGQTAGLAAEIFVEDEKQQGRLYLTNPTWRTSLRTLPLWDSLAYRDGRWKAARNLGPFLPAASGDGLLGGTTGRAAPRGETITRKDPVAEPAAADARGKATADSVAAIADAPLAGSIESVATLPVVERSERDLEYPEFSVRPGFQVQHVAGHEETGSILAMAFNEFGQILVSQEGGPLLLIYDSNDNGAPDQVRICCQLVSSCEGILPISGQVFVIADGAAGTALYRLEDEDRDGDFERATAILKFHGPLGEQGPHGLTLGPDGLIYIAMGNEARINQPMAMTSPLRNVYEGELVAPRYQDPKRPTHGIVATGGSVVRVDLEGKRAELFSGGLCNVHDVAFNGAGDLMMHDADTESDAGTPWHRPTRLIFAAPGSDYGWRNGWAKWPDYFLDSLPPIVDTGRGSPAGCLFYQHTAFPTKYRNAFFSCDWAQGAIYCFRLDRRGASYAAHRELFLQGKPLNVTDIDVGPDGALYFCTGGRGTQGNIFRVVYAEKHSPEQEKYTGIMQAMRQPGLNTAWGRQAISTMRQEMGNEWDRKIREFVADTQIHAIDRANALQVMHLIGPPPSDVELVDISRAADAAVRAKATYLMGLIGNELTSRRLVELLHDEVAIVRRKACEGLARTNQQVAFAELKPLLLSPDRFEAAAARGLLERNETEDWATLVLQSDHHRVFAQGALAMMRVSPSRSAAKRVVARFHELAGQFISDTDFVDMLRTVQIALEAGGLGVDDVPDLADLVVREFPAGNIQINRELTRLIVYLQASEAIDRMLAYIESDVTSIEKVHVGMHLRFLEQGWTADQRLRLCRYLETVGELQQNKSLGLYIQAVQKDVAALLTPEQRVALLEKGQEIPRMAVAILFALPEEDDLKNFESFRRLDYYIADLKGVAYERLRIGLVAVMARGAHDIPMAYLREAYDRSPERRQVIAMGLAQEPAGRNWDYLVRSIPLLEGGAAREVLLRLQQVNFAPEDPEHFRQLILCGLKLAADGGDDAADLLHHWTNANPDEQCDSWNTRLLAWQDWFQEKYPHGPQAALPLETGSNTWTYSDLMTFLSSPEAEHGSAERGSRVFAKARCAECHTMATLGNNYGPDLTSLRDRFQVREILESIIYPSQRISTEFKSHTIITGQGRQISGLVVPSEDGRFKAVSSDGRVLELKESDVDEVLPNNASTMPEGLLNALTLQEIADLFTFLGKTSSADVAEVPPPAWRK